VSKLTLVRSKTDNVLVIKHKQPAAGAAAGSSPQHRGRAGGPSPQGRCRSRAGRALKPKRPRLDAAERAATKDEQVRVRGGDDDDDEEEEDVQCKIVKVILENCKTPTTGTTTTAAAAPQETVVSSSSESPDATPAVHSSTSAAGEVTVAPRAASGARPVPPAASESPRSIAPSTGLVVPAPIQKTPIDAVATASGGGGLLATSLRASTPLNGVVSSLPLAAALAHPVHALQLLGAPVRHLPPPPPGAARWSVPLMNGAGAWLALQPVATASAPPGTGFLPGCPAPPRPEPAAAVVVGPARAPVAHSSSSSSSVISSPIKQFLEHASRSVPPLAQHAGGDSHDDRPTDLSMKTLRRLEVRARCLLLSYQSAFIHLWFIYYAIIYYWPSVL